MKNHYIPELIIEEATVSGASYCEPQELSYTQVTAIPCYAFFFLGMYKSVIVPSNTSVAIITDSLNVGCG